MHVLFFTKYRYYPFVFNCYFVGIGQTLSLLVTLFVPDSIGSWFPGPHWFRVGCKDKLAVNCYWGES